MTSETFFQFPSGDPERDGILLDRYLAGECPPSERAVMDAWFAARPRNQAQVTAVPELARDAIAPAAQLREPDLAKLRAGMWRHIGSADAPSQDSRRVGRSRQPVRPATMARWGWRVGMAAAFVAFSAGAYGVFRAARHAEPAAALASATTEVTTVRGQRASVRLPDGSRVTLNAASRLRYPRDFGVRSRDVVLEGEAYFEVVHNARTPFRVRTTHGVTEDVATRFAVRAYPGETSTRVVVEEGGVRVGPNVRLEAGDIALLVADTAYGVQRGVRIDHLLAWTKGQLEFDRVPMRDVVTELSRWYDVDVRVTDARLADRRFTASFRDASLDEVLDFVTRIYGARVERYGRMRLLVPASGARTGLPGE